jgi:hypothetical protein
MRNEVRSQSATTVHAGWSINPVTAPMIKLITSYVSWLHLLILMKTMVVNDQRAMMVQAQLIKEMQSTQNGCLLQMWVTPSSSTASSISVYL